MTAEVRLALALAAAAAAAYALTPVAISAAGRLEFFDRPKGYKGHAKPIPYLGGAAVLAAFVAAVLALAGDPARTVPLVGGVAVLWVVGTIDDRRHLPPLLRVVVETALAILMWAAGLGWDLGSEPLNLATTILWILAVVNAFNLFDNMDGASSAMAITTSAAIAILGVIEQDTWLVAVGAALAGSCLGFLPYNIARPQARIFLGDGGSMPIGFAVAVMVMSGAGVAADGWQALAAGLLLVGLPALDTALVIVSRRRKGISVLTGGRDHLTHRTRRRLGTARAVALSLGGAQAVIAAIALVALGIGPAAMIAVTVVGLAVAGGTIALLERQEDQLLAAGEIEIPAEALHAANARRAERPDPLTLGDAALVLFALGAALSPLARAYYNSDAWVPIGLGLTVVAAMGAIRRPQRLPVPAWLVLGGLTAIGALSLLSSGWAEAADLAITTGNRWLVLAVITGLGLVLVRSLRRDLIAVGALATGTLAVAAYVVARMLGPDAAELFLGGRLHQPLGYINALATVFLMGLWLCMPAVEQRRGWLAGLGMAGAVSLAGLVMLSSSRGAALAAVVSAVVVLVVVPGRLRRALALAFLAVCVAAISGPLLSIYDATLAAGGVTPTETVQRAAIRLLLVAGIAGVAWGVVAELESRLSTSAATTLQRAGRLAVGVLAAAALLAAVVSSDRIGNTLDRQWSAFTNVDPAGGSSPTRVTASERLASGAGNRYEYWRVAWQAFEREPIRGIGAGNFDHVWYAERRVVEAVRQPHSIHLQVLSELGVAGGIALLAALAGLLAAAVQSARLVRPATATGAVAVAAVGVPVTWLAHTSVDWMHLIPGTSAVALLMAAVLLRLPEHARAAAPAADADGVHDASPRTELTVGARRGSLLAAISIALVVATIGATLTRQAFADYYRARAVASIASAPDEAITQAQRSLRLNASAPRTYYAKAAALARLDRADEAEAALRAALAQDPQNAVTWTLLGDLATRRGREDEARQAYAQASRLDPLDPALRTLAGQPGP
ncbi:MAG: undecaprenyl/decaprenyl-phosphate alpha-N-acetylglucosaminyl 1-phosphate transferase [Solirubrobacteraceae bacterium]|nr:undecaprenyl/decaprenyl-phosphate alpha-N-acetylglucosaminyl 1-phosphate transferase [Solirubrobacteraceae bacterium]